MTRLHDVLRNGDPMRHEPPLGDSDIRAMRRSVLAAADRVPPAGHLMRHAVLVTTMAMLMVAAVLTIAQREPAVVPQTYEVPRQMELATPGGTRVIWVFDSGQR